MSCGSVGNTDKHKLNIVPVILPLMKAMSWLPTAPPPPCSCSVILVTDHIRFSETVGLFQQQVFVKQSCKHFK